MQYYSLNKQAPNVSFKEATVLGQAPDKGLYFPEKIPQLAKSLIADIKSYKKEELAFKVMLPYVGGTIADEALYEIVSETIDFEFPLVKINNQIASLELFHGPTLAF
jgi:threonine synthase